MNAIEIGGEVEIEQCHRSHGRVHFRSVHKQDAPCDMRRERGNCSASRTGDGVGRGGEMASSGREKEAQLAFLSTHSVIMN